GSPWLAVPQDWRDERERFSSGRRGWTLLPPTAATSPTTRSCSTCCATLVPTWWSLVWECPRRRCGATSTVTRCPAPWCSPAEGGSGSSPAPNAGRRGGCRQLVSSGPTGCTSSSPDWPAATHVVLCAWRAWRRAKWPCGPQGTRPKVPNCAPTDRVASGLAVDDLDPARATFVD